MMPGSPETDNVRAPAKEVARAPTVEHVQEPVADGTSEYDADDSEEVYEEADNAKLEIKEEEQKEVKAQETGLHMAISTTSEYLRKGLTSLFGNVAGVTEEQIEEIVEEVEQNVTTQVIAQFEEEADKYLKEQEDRIDETAGEAIEEGEDIEEARDSIAEQETEAIGELHDAIDGKAKSLRRDIDRIAKEKEIAILEHRLGQKFNQPVKLTLIDEEIKGLDELLDDAISLPGGLSADATPSVPAGDSHNDDDLDLNDDEPAPEESSDVDDEGFGR